MLAVSGIFAAAKMTHLSHDEAVPKMGHPVFWLDADLGHPPSIQTWTTRPPGVVARFETWATRPPGVVA